MSGQVNKFVILLLLFTVSGCELFQPRTPQPPINNNSPYQWLQPTTWDIVLTDLELSFKALDRKYFLDVLADTTNSATGFTFIPDANTASSSGVDFTD